MNFYHQFHLIAQKQKEFILKERETGDKKINFRKMSKGTGQRTFYSLAKIHISNLSKMNLTHCLTKKEKLFRIFGRRTE